MVIELPIENSNELPGLWAYGGDVEKLDVRMTPRYLTAVTLFIAFPFVIRGTSGRVGSLFLEESRW